MISRKIGRVRAHVFHGRGMSGRARSGRRSVRGPEPGRGAATIVRCWRVEGRGRELLEQREWRRGCEGRRRREENGIGGLRPILLSCFHQLRIKKQRLDMMLDDALEKS